MKVFLPISLVLALVWALPGHAATNEEMAEAINEAAKERARGWGSARSVTRMTIRNRRGQESIRVMEGRAVELEGDNGRSILLVREPPDAEGIALLTHSYSEKSDDVWLYLPAVKRVKRVTGKGRSGYFLGSDFRYSDFTSTDPADKYRLTLVGEEKIGELYCHILERSPREGVDSDYARTRIWVDQQEYRVPRLEYYDRDNVLEKTLHASEFSLYQERYWRAGRVRMENHLSKGETLLETLELEFDLGYQPGDFTTNSLKRMR